jgi:hypothetical protein
MVSLSIKKPTSKLNLLFIFIHSYKVKFIIVTSLDKNFLISINDNKKEVPTAAIAILCVAFLPILYPKNPEIKDDNSGKITIIIIYFQYS